jgi:hypothetical protein
MVRQRSPRNPEKDRLAEGGRLLQNRESKKMGRGGSPSGPKIQPQTRRLPQPKSSRRDAGTQRREFWDTSKPSDSHEGTKPQRKSVVEMAVLCRFRAILQSRESKKMGRGGSPSGPKIQARTRRLPPTQILPQRRRDAEEGILESPGILPRRAAALYEVIPQILGWVGLKFLWWKVETLDSESPGKLR